MQVNLGNNETWDTHGDIFPRLKDKLFPPTDRALCALMDDLLNTGLLESTLIVMASEFGRTPKLSTLDTSYPLPGRDHWGACGSMFFAGAGIKTGQVVGTTDKQGAYPLTRPYGPADIAATIYHSLGIEPEARIHDRQNRPAPVLDHGKPIDEVLA